MEDDTVYSGVTLLPVFCTAAVSTATIDALITTTREYNTPDTVPMPYLVTSQDLSTALHASRAPTQSFTSPFLGQSLSAVKDWFGAHVVSPPPPGSSEEDDDDDPRRNFAQRCFLVLDERSDEGPGTGVLVSLRSPSFETIRIDFVLAAQTAGVVEYTASGCGWLDEGTIDTIRRNGGVLTNDNIDLAKNNGLHIEDGEVKRQASWQTRPSGDAI